MKSFKKAARLLGFAILIILACFGIGLGGGAPVPSANKRENIIEISTEPAQIEEDNTDVVLFDIKQ